MKNVPYLAASAKRYSLSVNSASLLNVNSASLLNVMCVIC